MSLPGPLSVVKIKSVAGLEPDAELATIDNW